MSLLRLLELEDRGDCAVGSLNGANSVEIVPAPTAGYTRKVRAIRFVNKDTAAVDIRLRVSIAGPTHYEVDNVIGLGVDGKFFPVEGADELRLTSDESVTAIMGGAAATTNPPWYAAWIDVPVAT